MSKRQSSVPDPLTNEAGDDWLGPDHEAIEGEAVIRLPRKLRISRLQIKVIRTGTVTNWPLFSDEPGLPCELITQGHST